MSNSSLSSVVSTLVRASMGASVSNTVTDDDLDRHVAELILKEAKQKAESYLQHGVRAYLPDTGSAESNLPRANKRFLSSIIRSTDDHNKAVLRAQAEAAQEIKAAKEEHERKERTARASEAAEAERIRRLMGGSRRSGGDKWARDRDHKRRERSWERVEADSGKRKRRRSSSGSRERPGRHSERRRGREYDRDEEITRHRSRLTPEATDKCAGEADRRSKDRQRSHTQPLDSDPHLSSHSDTHGSTPHSVHSRSHSRSPAPQHLSVPVKKSRRSHRLAEDDSERPSSSRRNRHRSTSPPRRHEAASKPEPSRPSQPRRNLRLSPTLSEEEDIERQPLRSSRTRRNRLRSPPSETPPILSSSRTSLPGSRSPSPAIPSSKMDKYFEPSYDPRLDVAPLALPHVPSTGLIDGAEFEGWDTMLDIIRQRREDRIEKKRLERLGLLPDSSKEKKEKDKDKDKGTKKKGEKEKVKESDRWTMDGGSGIMDIEYKKRGSVREWDVGKEGF